MEAQAKINQAQARRAAAAETAVQDDHVEGFYNMNELADLLGMNVVEVAGGHGSRAQSHQNQMMPFLSGSTKDGKLTSVETYTEQSSYMGGNPTNQSNL